MITIYLRKIVVENTNHTFYFLFFTFYFLSARYSANTFAALSTFLTQGRFL